MDLEKLYKTIVLLVKKTSKSSIEVFNFERKEMQPFKFTTLNIDKQYNETA